MSDEVQHGGTAPGGSSPSNTAAGEAEDSQHSTAADDGARTQRPKFTVDPAMAASVAAGAAWLAGKGVHRVRKRRVKKRGEAKTKVGGHVSNIAWTVIAAGAAALVEIVVNRLLKRSRGK